MGRQNTFSGKIELRFLEPPGILECAAIIELLKRGGNIHDEQQLRSESRNAYENNKTNNQSQSSLVETSIPVAS
jgi:hypothetical protein